MRRARQLVHAVLLTTATVSALADFTIAEAAASQSRSPDLASSTLVLRGSTDSPEQVAAASDGGAPTVLRGSPPSAPQPHATPYSCNPGFDYDLEDERFALVTASPIAALVTALVTASPTLPGSGADSRPESDVPRLVFRSIQTIHWSKPDQCYQQKLRHTGEGRCLSRKWVPAFRREDEGGRGGVESSEWVGALDCRLR
jgi:hypothetical protein